MFNYTSIQVSDSFVAEPATATDYANIVNETGRSLDYRVNCGTVATLADG